MERTSQREDSRSALFELKKAWEWSDWNLCRRRRGRGDRGGHGKPSQGVDIQSLRNPVHLQRCSCSTSYPATPISVFTTISSSLYTSLPLSLVFIPLPLGVFRVGDEDTCKGH
ncbi:hypothetical protein KC19_VG020900 [Ceratodon purpureus]|uniref:Uncharacterized protein n=1 Tax=Ceratodon purpureus TaxID=3225 RepID=A0A8T0HL53_CERPU|nr:hypothetical protein KC19_VG020900 [Ceratodon purpureus]